MSERLHDSLNNETRTSDTERKDRVLQAPAPINAARSGENLIRSSYQRILDAFAAHGSMTPDELAAKVARSVFYTRPRCSELRALGLLRTTGETRPNATSGLHADVLSL